MNATPASATSIRVSWAYSANPSTLTIRGGYRIQYTAVSPIGISDAGNVTVSRLRSSHIVYGLEEGVRYKITVNAYVGSSSGVSKSTYVSTYTAGMFYLLNLPYNPHFLYLSSCESLIPCQSEERCLIHLSCSHLAHGDCKCNATNVRTFLMEICLILDDEL